MTRNTQEWITKSREHPHKHRTPGERAIVELANQVRKLEIENHKQRQTIKWLRGRKP